MLQALPPLPVARVVMLPANTKDAKEAVELLVKQARRVTKAAAALAAVTAAWQPDQAVLVDRLTRTLVTDACRAAQHGRLLDLA